MIHLRKFRQVSAILAAAVSLFVLAACQTSGLGTASLPAPPSAPMGTMQWPATTAVNARGYPAVPAILPKPLVLGPAYPAVIPVAWQRTEPWIRVKITRQSPVRPWINPILYRGRIEIDRLPDGRYIALNVLPIEDYLAGVLSRELYGNWLPATYDAQAIAARTYALYQMETFGKTHAWDVTGNQNSQMYGGRNAETPRAWNAVRATWGQVMMATKDGMTGIFCAYYSACNGGAIQSAADAWGDQPLPELGARVTGDLDDQCRLFSWPTMRISKAFVRQAVTWWGQRNKLPYLADLGPISDVEITRYNRITNRPEIITLIDVHGHIGKMRAEEFRLALLMDPNRRVKAPPSSFFKIRNDGAYILLVDGHGYGHGVGLSQWGAQALAQRGYSGDYILSYFYPGERIHKLW
jgi:stage II sporulation protein D